MEAGVRIGRDGMERSVWLRLRRHLLAVEMGMEIHFERQRSADLVMCRLQFFVMMCLPPARC
jgi:hypothetical protein